MAKKRKAARKRVTRKPTRKRRARSPDATINTLVILVVIVIVLGGLYLYAQNKKQAALWPSLTQTVETLIAPQPTT
jgi:Ni,Fe-hydrogenase I cytochrome b subunit